MRRYTLSVTSISTSTKSLLYSPVYTTEVPGSHENSGGLVGDGVGSIVSSPGF